MQVEPGGIGDVVVLHPGCAVAIGARDEEAMQRGDEHGALDGELETPVGEQLAENPGNAEPLPDFAEQQRPADAHRRGGQRATLVLVEG